MRKLNSIRLKNNKVTENLETVELPIPKKVKIPMIMSIGDACIPSVKVGDEVFVGQKIADSNAFLSLPIHSSVSGKVVAISYYNLANGKTCKAVEIETDGKQTLSPNISKPLITSKDSFLHALRESGSCGLGGAGFPTYIKLDPKTTIKTLIINGAECEPYITSDYRQMMESPDDIINGIKYVMQCLNIPKATIAIEGNKPKAIEVLKKRAENSSEIEVVALPSRYPQGAEKVIIYTTTGKIIEEGQLPSEQGIVVINISTIAFIYQYIQNGIPLVTKRITVDGDAIQNPCNVFAPIGTPVSDILSFAKAETDEIKKLLLGGPMMGMSLYSLDTPIVKTSNAVLAFKTYEKRLESPCIRCGRCVSVCPLNLMPVEIEKSYIHNKVDELKKLKVSLCMNCGCCSYTCPANRKLAESHQLAKALIQKG